MKPAFRIDYARGSFRYKCVQIEKGNVALHGPDKHRHPRLGDGNW